MREQYVGKSTIDLATESNALQTFRPTNAVVLNSSATVKIPGCGGVLIASEWVLTAKHCGNFEGRAVIVGAHHQSAPGVFRGGAARVCTEYVGHPGFTSTGCEFCPPFENDFALVRVKSTDGCAEGVRMCRNRSVSERIHS